MDAMGAQLSQTGSGFGRVSALESVALEVRNPSRAIHFYTEVLGLELVSGGQDTPGPLVLRPVGGGSSITLHRLFDGSARPGDNSAARPALRWTGLRLSTENLDSVHAALRESRANILQQPQDQPWGVRECVFSDPDGNVFSLVQHIAS